MISERNGQSNDMVATQLAVDAHVHWPADGDHGAVLDRAWRGLFGSKMRRSVSGSDASLGFLLLAQTPSQQVFDALATQRAVGHRWSLSRTDEGGSLVARSDAGQGIVLVEGYQLVSCEGLELLAFGPIEPPADGLPLKQLVDALQGSAVTLVIPWGVGKWSGQRGRILDDLLADARPGNLFLGDNGGRPALWTEPGHFGRARGNGIFNLPGSDPLPLPGQTARIGHYGFRLTGQVSTERPWHDLQVILRGLGEQPQTFGTRPGLLTSLSAQSRMQWRKRVARGRGRA